jgi:hypothetical protein
MTFLLHIWHACAGFRTYRHFAALPFRSALSYWMAFSLLLTVVFAGNVLHLLYRMDVNMPKIRQVGQAIPSLMISNGVAYSQLPQPSILNTNQFPVIIDLGNTITAPEKRFPSGLMVNKRDFQLWLDKEDFFTSSLILCPNGTVDAGYFERLPHEILQWFPVVCAFAWLGFVALGLLQALFFSVLLNLLEMTIEPRLVFRQLFNIAVFALTPGAIISATYVSVGISNEIKLPMLCLCCYCLFLVLAIGACRMPEEKEEDES